MRLALLSAAALLALVALGALLWLRPPSRSTEAGPARAVVEQEAARGEAELAPAAPDGEIQRSALPEEAPADSPAPALAQEAQGTLADGHELAILDVQVLADEDGRPVQDVYLRFEALLGGEDLRPPSMTDAAGSVIASLPAGTVRVSCNGQPDRSLELELAPGKHHVATLKVRRDADVDFHLRLVDAGTGEPIPRALVRPDRSMHPYLIGATATARADDLGFATVRLASWADWWCQVSAEGYGSAKLRLAGDHGSRGQAMTVRLARSARLEGVVLDDGAPLERARVSAKVSELALNARNPDLLIGLAFPVPEQEWTAVSLAGGRYELAELPSGVDLTLEVSARGELVLQEVDALRLEPGEVRVRDIRLFAPGAIEGVVLDAGGAPAKGVHLLLVRGSEPRMLDGSEPDSVQTRTDKQGRFAFQRVPPGTWLIGPLALVGPKERGRAPEVPLAQVVELPPGVAVIQVELHLLQSLLIEGRCVGPDGEAVGEANVFTLLAGSSVNVTSTADGAFALGPLPPGEYQLFADKRQELTLGEPLLARAGDRDVIVRLGRGARLHGSVVEAGGAGAEAQIQSTFKHVDGSMLLNQYTTDEAGLFELSALPAGRYVLVARTASGLVSAPHALVLGASDELSVQLTVAPGGQVHLQLPTGAFARISIDGELADFLQGDATSRILSPGPILIEVVKDSWLVQQREESITAGEVLQLDLR